MKMNKIYAFDLDGTLVNSMPYYTKGMYSVLDKRGIKYQSDLIKILTPLGYTGTAKYYIENFGLSESVDQIVAEMEQCLVFEYSNNIKLKDGVKEFLEKIKSKGAKLYVLTASPHIVTDICLKNNGVYSLFDTVWSVEDYGINKSNPELFHIVANKIGCLEGEINYFEDNLEAVINASAAGFNTYAVKDESSQEPEYTEKLKTAAPHFIESFRELL